jgi:UDP-N-acetylmuramoylalanine--D-glutamate ligase
MKERPPLPPAPYLVVGLARSGVAAAQALRAAAPQARIVACDRKNPPEAQRAAEGLRRAGVEVHTDTDGTELLDAGSPPKTIVKSPGVPAEAPVIAAARERGIGVVGELEIGWRLVPNDFYAVTGTNGKTTTTELIGEVHRQAGLAVAIAGNVGTPVSAFAGTLPAEATVACEASSFQLEDSVEFAPEVAVFLNLAEDHLDRHGTLDRYRDAKLSILARQRSGDIAVLNADEPALAESKPGDLGGDAQRVWFGEGEASDLRLYANTMSWRGEHLVDASEVRLPGTHNLRNAMAAAAATLARGVDTDAVRAALREFAGIAHRFEHVADVGGVQYVNDSKATNPAAAAAALGSFRGDVHAILGGSLKGGGFEQLVPAVAASCRCCYLIGEAAPALEAALAGAGVELLRCGDLERAVARASERAQPGETVLLAPACASFDQYRDFAERGEHFKSLVGALRERAAGGDR